MNQTSLVGRPLAALTRTLVGFAEKRGVWSGPLLSSSPELARLWAGPGTNTGVSVSEASALTYSVVWACVNNISTDVASLPLILYKNLPNGGKERLTRHPLYRILHDEPNAEQSPMTFRGMIQAHALTWGNGYAEIVRDGGGRVAALEPITPDRVTVKRDGRGKLYYEVSRYDSGMDRLKPEDMFHIQGLGYDGTVGYNLIAKARESIALGLATERFGGSFFGNGATFGGVISMKEQLTELARESFRKQMDNQHQGVDRAHKFLLLGNEATYQKLGVDPDHAQFLETRDRQVEEICRYYRMPPHKVQHLLRSTNNNIEHQGIEYYSDTLRPWCVRWEQEIKRKLIAPSERMIQSAEHKIEGVLRGDLASRYAAYAVGRQWGWLSANRICELENMDPLPSGGDVFLVPMNMAPADRINDIVDKQVAPDPKPVAPVAAEQKADDDEEKKAQQMADEIRAHLVAVEARIMETATQIGTLQAEKVQTIAEAGTLRASLDSLQAKQAEAEQEAGRLRALLLEATERADRLAIEKEAERTAAEAVRAELQTAEATIADTSTKLTDATVKASVLETERDTALTACADATLKADALTQAHATALVELQTGADAERLAAAQKVGELSTLKAEAEAQRDAKAADLERVDAELDTAKAEAATYAQELVTLRAQVAGATVAAENATEAARVATTEAQAVRVEAEQAKTAQAAVEAAMQALRAEDEARAETLRTALAEAAAAKAMAESAVSERVSFQAAYEKAVEAHAAALATEQAKAAEGEATLRALEAAHGAYLQSMLPSRREMWIDALTRLVRVERDRATRNQGSPTKAKSWAEAFYPQQEDRYVDALRALSRDHLVFIHSDMDVDEFTRALIGPQLQAAVVQIRTVADGDPEDFHVSLERILTKWEQDRPKAIADRLFQEEMTYVRSL